MSEKKDIPDLLNRPAGAISLSKYRAHGGGIELFRAFVERRIADRQANLDRKAQVIATITPKAGVGVPVDVFERARAELTALQILEEMDPIIKDLLKFCESAYPQDDQLPQLRSALRIGNQHAPDDSRKIDKKWAIQQRWIDHYLAMQSARKHVSQNLIARAIAKEFGVSPRTAINHWQEKTRSQTWQLRWARDIELHAKARSAIVKKFGTDAGTFSAHLLKEAGKPKIAKKQQESRKTKVPRKQKITFGKGV